MKLRKTKFRRERGETELDESPKGHRPKESSCKNGANSGPFLSFSSKEKTVSSPCNEDENGGSTNCNNKKANTITLVDNTKQQPAKKELIASIQLERFDEGIATSTLLEPADSYKEV